MSKLDLFHSELVNDYLNFGMSMRALEAKYGINRKYIKSHLIKNSIPIKKHGSIPPHIQVKLDDKAWLEASYNSTRSSQKIADALGVTKQCVLKYMKAHCIDPQGNRFYFSGKPDDIEVPDEVYLTESKYTSSKPTHKPMNQTLHNKDWLKSQYQDTMNIKTLAERLRLSYQSVQNALHYHNIPIVRSGNTSNNETMLMNRMNHLNPVQSYKLDGIELDLYFPDYDLAVEIHGLRFHSELSGGKSRQYHQNKYEVCKRHGIHLYQFWDNEVAHKTNLVCNMIQAKCGSAIKLNARDYNVVHGDDVGEFLDLNHIQGSTNYSKSVSLTTNGETIAVMTFIKSRNKQYNWELNRYCVKAGYNVRGAFSRLLKHGPTGTVVSYSDCRYSDGGVYRLNGFTLTRTNDPIYYYTKDYKKLESRMAFQKSRIKSKFPDKYNPLLTEWQNMQNLGYDRVWACKTYTWVKTL